MLVHNNKKRSKGFTLVELLVVISIISSLSTVVIGAVNEARSKARDNIRVQNLVTLRDAIESYYLDHGSYPKTFEPGEIMVVTAECAGNPTDYIPGLVPNYVPKLPSDPVLDCDGDLHSWFYASDGIDYKLITHTEGDYFPIFTDPEWVGVHYGVWSPGAVNWVL